MPDIQSGSSSSSGSSSEDESRSSKAKKRAAKRHKWICQLYSHLDRLDLPAQVDEEDDASWQFSLEKKPSRKISYPIYKGVSSQLSKLVKVKFDQDRRKTKFDPVVGFAKSYSSMEPDHKHLNKPHTVSSLIIDEVKEPRLIHCSNPSPDARLSTITAPGRVEKSAIQQQLFSQTMFRISNALSLSLQALNTIVDKSRQEIASFRSMTPLTDVPKESLCILPSS